MLNNGQKGIYNTELFVFLKDTDIEVMIYQRPDLFVEFLGWYEDNDSTYFSLEYMGEGDLGKYLATNGPQTEADTKEITKQILEGLSFLHEREICHRDLKPEVRLHIFCHDCVHFLMAGLLECSVSFKITNTSQIDRFRIIKIHGRLRPLHINRNPRIHGSRGAWSIIR